MKILVACEESQVVTAAFRARGHEAFSCDILPTSGTHPEWHLQGNVKYYIRKPGWDMMLAFPPCTHLAVSGARYFEEKRKDGRQQEAIDFFRYLWDAWWIDKIAIENPVGIMSTELCKPTQIIQPYDFGEDASKKTCLWLKGLSPLTSTKYTEPRIINGKKLWANQTNSGQNKLAPSPDRAALRSKTYQGIADAMAQQWG